VNKAAVRHRAGGRCEYCLIPESFVGVPFHREHIIARQHGGTDKSENLALACPECNSAKGPNIASIDPATGALISLFYPRVQPWATHFEVNGVQIRGRTGIGRATASLLDFNHPQRLIVRIAMRRRQLWPLNESSAI
jgi:hypothetical protein